MYKHKSLWSLSILLLLTWFGLGISLYIHSVPVPLLVTFAATLLLIFAVIKLHHNAVPQSIIDGLFILTRQLKRFENGTPKDSPLKYCPKELLELSKAITSHLKLESDRIAHEQMFGSEASHELRTPLAGIRLQAQIAQRTTDPEQQKKSMGNIIKAIDRSTRLVQQLLTFSKLTKRRTEAERSKVKVSEIINKVVDSHKTTQKERNIKVSLSIDVTEPIEMESHGEHLAILFDNLYSNSMNHTPKEGTISLSLTIVSNQLTFVVEDSGLGAEESEYARLMVPFQKSKDGRLKGTGLGLAICNRIVALHDGQLILSKSVELKGLAVRAHLFVNGSSTYR